MTDLDLMYDSIIEDRIFNSIDPELESEAVEIGAYEDDLLNDNQNIDD